MNLRNQPLLHTLENHPLKGALARTLDIAEEFSGAVEHVGTDRNLSDTGRASAIQKHLRTALRDLRDARGPIEELKGKLAAKKEAVKLPPFDKADVVGFLRRQEMRQAVRGMALAERMAVITGPHADVDATDAVLELSPLFSGFSDPMTEKVYAQARENRLQALFGRELSEIAELETTIAEANSVADIARVDISVRSGLQPQQFEQFAKPIETRANAPWLIKNGAKVTVVDLAKRGTNGMYREATPDEARDGKTYANEQEYLADRKSA